MVKKTGVWPIGVLGGDGRGDFLSSVVDSVVVGICDRFGDCVGLRDLILGTVASERGRIRRGVWRVDADDSVAFLDWVAGGVVGCDYDGLCCILRCIVDRYVCEIGFVFDGGKYGLMYGLTRGGLGGVFSECGFFGDVGVFDDRVRVLGCVDDVVGLGEDHTLVFVPNHCSNVDSMVLGGVCGSVGLPPLVYGAGLNLFNSRLFDFFMGGLGGYKIDRRRKDFIYLETLKCYYSMVLGGGCHSVFYPGGGRSRSGMLERRLKLGLLGTALRAQLDIFRGGDCDRRVVVVPVVMSYQCVIEAPVLARDFFSVGYGVGSFLGGIGSFYRFWRGGSSVVVRFCRPFDVLGNFIDVNGVSYDSCGGVVDLRGGLLSGSLGGNGVGFLADRIVDSYSGMQYVFCCYVVAFVAFLLMRMLVGGVDDVEFFALDSGVHRVCIDDLRVGVGVLRDVILSRRGSAGFMFGLDDLLVSGGVDDIICEGVSTLGVYHVDRPLVVDGDFIMTNDIYALYYYHNRLMGYGFEEYI